MNSQKRGKNPKTQNKKTSLNSSASSSKKSLSKKPKEKRSNSKRNSAFKKGGMRLEDIEDDNGGQVAAKKKNSLFMTTLGQASQLDEINKFRNNFSSFVHPSILEHRLQFQNTVKDEQKASFVQQKETNSLVEIMKAASETINEKLGLMPETVKTIIESRKTGESCEKEENSLSTVISAISKLTQESQKFKKDVSAAQVDVSKLQFDSSKYNLNIIKMSSERRIEIYERMFNTCLNSTQDIVDSLEKTAPVVDMNRTRLKSLMHRASIKKIDFSSIPHTASKTKFAENTPEKPMSTKNKLNVLKNLKFNKENPMFFGDISQILSHSSSEGQLSTRSSKDENVCVELPVSTIRNARARQSTRRASLNLGEQSKAASRKILQIDTETELTLN